LDSLNVTLLYLYSQNYIVMEEMEIMQNGEDPNSGVTKQIIYFGTRGVINKTS
jgi:hypothetical protein